MVLSEFTSNNYLLKHFNQLKRYHTNVFRDKKTAFEIPDRFQITSRLLWYCAQKMPYPEFYQAWHAEPTVHPEVADYTAVGYSSIAQSLNQQLILDRLPQEVQPTTQTYPLFINIATLAGVTDTSAIAQEFCNKIYTVAFPDNTHIPEVNNAAQLKRWVPKIRQQLAKSDLALIITGCKPEQNLVNFCHQISDVFHIAWITDEPVSPPWRGFLPHQQNLSDVIQTWMDEIG